MPDLGTSGKIMGVSFLTREPASTSRCGSWGAMWQGYDSNRGKDMIQVTAGRVHVFDRRPHVLQVDARADEGRHEIPSDGPLKQPPQLPVPLLVHRVVAASEKVTDQSQGQSREDRRGSSRSREMVGDSLLEGTLGMDCRRLFGLLPVATLGRWSKVHDGIG